MAVPKSTDHSFFFLCCFAVVCKENVLGSLCHLSLSAPTFYMCNHLYIVVYIRYFFFDNVSLMSAYADLQRTHRVLEGVYHFRDLPTVRTTHSHAYHVAQRHTSVSRAVLSILTERTTTERLLQYIEEKAKARTSPVAAQRCCICLKKTRTHVLVPCGHFKYCSVCVEKISSCAICRKHIVHKVRVYE